MYVLYEVFPAFDHLPSGARAGGPTVWRNVRYNAIIPIFPKRIHSCLHHSLTAAHAKSLFPWQEESAGMWFQDCWRENAHQIFCFLPDLYDMYLLETKG